MTFRDRASWYARPPREPVPLVAPLRKTEVVLHRLTGPGLSAPDPAQWVRNLQDHHMDVLGWVDIGYSYLVDEEGNIFEGRGWLTIGAHTRNHNVSADGIAYLDNGNPITEVVLASIRNLFNEADYRSGNTRARLLHSDIDDDTDCPGPLLTDWFYAGMPLIGDGPEPEAPEPKPELPVPEELPASELPPQPGIILPAVMQIGDTGDGVRQLQARLDALGYFVIQDGVFDHLTYRNVVGFQSQQSLTPDGVVGPLTWARLWVET